MRTFISSGEWRDHYQANALNQLPIPWEVGGTLTAEEARAIVRSLQAWQLGETSEGAQMLAAAKRYAAQADDPEFVDAVRLFIAEEQRHGELLGRFLDLNGAGRIRRNWGDAVFRKLRHLLPNMEVWTTVVIGVETLALVYYRAIMLATKSPVLKTICRQILKDEVYHLRFQYERLAQIGLRRGRFAWWLTSWAHRILFAATTLAVWVGHHRALCAGGFHWNRFWRASWNRMEFHWKLMRREAWTRSESASSQALYEVGTRNLP